jgi:cytochrome b pre-mRNA-processing protein 3
MILAKFWRRPQAPTIGAVYGMIVAQARAPAFYRALGVPDTIQGRFDLLVLHLVLTMHRMGGAADPGRARSQELFDRFCRDLDDNLREMGIGDLAVPKEMRRLGEAFYGRQSAYLAALAAGDDGALENALARNIFGTSVVTDRTRRMAAYVHAAVRELEAQGEAALLRGEIAFPDPEAVAHDGV